VRLLRRLESALERVEIDVCGADRVIDIDARLAEIAVSTAVEALERVARGVGDRGDALARLDDAAIEVAVLAVRGAINTERFGTPRPSTVVTDSQLCELGRTTARIAAYAEAQRARTETRHAAEWLQDAILASDRVVRCATLREAERDPVLRADVSAALRASWVALACTEMLVVIEIEALISTPTNTDLPALCAKVAARACSALCAAALVDRPDDFDHSGAAQHQRVAVIRSVGPLAIALQTDQRRQLERVRGTILERLARVVAAAWSLDECLAPNAAGGSGQ
jgi:hypothetical protein